MARRLLRLSAGLGAQTALLQDYTAIVEGFYQPAPVPVWPALMVTGDLRTLMGTPLPEPAVQQRGRSLRHCSLLPAPHARCPIPSPHGFHDRRRL